MATVGGSVRAVRTANLQSGAEGATLGQDRQGGLLASGLHGKWFQAAVAGAMFLGCTAPAGTTIPISSATAATFTLYNPPGSGVNAELVKYTCGINNATLVVAALFLGISPNPATAPSSVTEITATTSKGKIATTDAACKLYSAATVVATTNFYLMGTAASATSGAVAGISQFSHDFDGSVILPPGTFVHVVGTAAQSQAWAQQFVWAEWPATT